eukprot:3395280-Pyramimonas_sp.AAC.1
MKKETSAKAGQHSAHGLMPCMGALGEKPGGEALSESSGTTDVHTGDTSVTPSGHSSYDVSPT